MATIRECMSVRLQDDDTECGGVSFVGETLLDFLTETGIKFDMDDDVSMLDELLIESGIRPIRKE